MWPCLTSEGTRTGNPTHEQGGRRECSTTIQVTLPNRDNAESKISWIPATLISCLLPKLLEWDWEPFDVESATAMKSSSLVFQEQEVNHWEGFYMEKQLSVWNQEGPGPTYYLWGLGDNVWACGIFRFCFCKAGTLLSLRSCHEIHSTNNSECAALWRES